MIDIQDILRSNLPTGATGASGATGEPGATGATGATGEITPGVQAGSETQGYITYTGITPTNGSWYGGSTDPTNTTRLNYDGHLHAAAFFGDGSNLSGIATDLEDPLLAAIVLGGNASTAQSSAAQGGGSDQVFWENDTTITTNYTITQGKNAVTAGPVTINDGVIITVPPGSTWTIV
jgi:hypothetical protein